MSRFTLPELIAVGHAAEKLLGRTPSREDFRGENRKKLESALGVPVPHEATLSKPFGSWGEYLRACGWNCSGREIDKIERAAVDHCIDALGITEEAADRSITDGWYPDGRTVEIKGSVLRKRSSDGLYFFGFRLHSRELSASADELILVGLSRDLEPILRLQIPKQAMPSMTDGLSMIMIYATAIWGNSDSKYRRFVRWHERESLDAAITRWGVEGSS